MLHEEGRSPLIGTNLHSMVATIELNHKPVGWATEIDDIWTDRVLPTKLGLMELPISQLPPENPLTISLSPAKPSGAATTPAPLTLPLSPFGGEGTCAPLLHWASPHTNRKKSLLLRNSPARCR